MPGNGSNSKKRQRGKPRSGAEATTVQKIVRRIEKKVFLQKGNIAQYFNMADQVSGGNSEQESFLTTEGEGGGGEHEITPSYNRSSITDRLRSKSGEVSKEDDNLNMQVDMPDHGQLQSSQPGHGGAEIHVVGPSQSLFQGIDLSEAEEVSTIVEVLRRLEVNVI